MLAKYISKVCLPRPKAISPDYVFTMATVLPIERPAGLTLYLATGGFSVFVTYWLLYAIYVAFFGPLSKFPGPVLNKFTQLPLLRQVASGNEAHYHKCLHDQYGTVVRTGPYFVSFIGDAQTWKDVHGFQKAGRQLPQKDLRLYIVAPNRVPSLIPADDATHARQRKILSHAFSDAALKEQEPLLKRWAGLFLSKLMDQADGAQKVDMLKMLNCTTFDIMSDLTFAEPLHMLSNSEYSPWVKAIFGGIKRNMLFRCVRTLHPAVKQCFDTLIPRIPSLRKNILQHWSFTVQRVDRRLAKTPDRPDLWSRILERSKNAETQLTVEEQYSNASLFMTAGTETTATALSGTIFYLSQNPDSLATLKAEVYDAFNSFDDLHLDPLARCRYMDAVLREALRLYPPVPIGLPRVIPKGGASIGGHFVPGGTGVSIPQMPTYCDARNWTDPERFAPERWLGDHKYENDNRGCFEPFSTGPRNCLGKVCDALF